MARRKLQSRTISWGQWCEELGTATGVDTTGLRNQDGELLEFEDETEETEYEDPYEQYDPTLRGKPTNRVWNTTPSPNKTDPGRRQEQSSRDTGRRAERDEKYRQGKDDDDDPRVPEERLRQDKERLRQVIADLNQRVITVRMQGPPGLTGLDSLGEAYRNLDSQSDGIETLDVDQVKSLKRQADELSQRADSWEQLFKKYPKAGDLATWAVGCGSKDFNAELTKPMLDMQRKAMSDALVAQPVDETSFGAACDELAKLKAAWEPVDAARQKFNDAMSRLTPDLQICLKNGTDLEVKDLQAAKGNIEQLCRPNTQKVFEQALKELVNFGKLVQKCVDAHNDRAERKRQCIEDFKNCREQFTVVREKLSGDEHVKFKRESKQQFEDTIRSVKQLLDNDLKDFQPGKTEDQISSLRNLVEQAQQRFEDMEAKLAERDRIANAITDKAEFSRFKPDDPRTWIKVAPISWGKVPQSAVDVSGADHVMVARILDCDLGDDSGIQTGRAYHCHMLNGGSGGISFAYNHLGGRRVQPVVYDYATNRHENNSGRGGKYDWLLGGGKKNPNSSPLPSSIKRSRPPRG